MMWILDSLDLVKAKQNTGQKDKNKNTKNKKNNKNRPRTLSN